MQSRPSKVSKATSDYEHSDASIPTSQHGLRHGSPASADASSGRQQFDSIGPSDQWRHREDGSSRDDAQEDTRLSTPSWLSTGEIRDSASWTANVLSNPSSPPIHGEAVASTPASPILTLPNEILTHTLSHLTPTDLSSVSLISHRFHGLVTTPHAWRAAFARFFPGPTALNASSATLTEKTPEKFRSNKRAFCRLTALATWRSEYVLRTGLLRSLARGKPVHASSLPSMSRGGNSVNAVMMYNSQLFSPITHLDAAFGSGLSKTAPRFMHGADGHASSSDPMTGRVGNWGISDPQMFVNFEDHFFGETMWGLGPGEIVGLPNTMSVSQLYGMVCGEGAPNGGLYFRSVDEMRGRFLAGPTDFCDPESGIPKIDHTQEVISSLWIAKSAAIPGLTEGLVGIMSGSSMGAISAYSLGAHGLRDHRLGRGELTARWILSPGVPIIALAVDEAYSLHRQAQNRVWAVALNALGEMYYLTKFPKRFTMPRGSKLENSALERLAWSTGRTVHWNLVELSRRSSRPDPYGESQLDGSYSPRSSWNGMCLSKDQIKAECHEIEVFLRKLPKDFRKLSLDWDMQRKLEVDFAGDDGNFAGESMMVFQCGLNDGAVASVTRFIRFKVSQDIGIVITSRSTSPSVGDRTPMVEQNSVFGDFSSQSCAQPRGLTDHGISRGPASSSNSYDSREPSPERTPKMGEWRCSRLTFGGAKAVQITAVALDCSLYAMLTRSEDPAVGMLGSSEASSTVGSPLFTDSRSTITPGQRARFVAAGTKTGSIYVWDCRAGIPDSIDVINNIDPVRVIHTDSPEISCLGMTALQLVHGGNDGLVQAWDPLASGSEPVRTLNSRFSSKGRRRLVQAQNSTQGVGVNMFAAGAICLDPDPTVLRGMVSLGTHLRYWSYSSLAADGYKGSKRRLRHSDRGSNNQGGTQYSGAIRNAGLKAYITNERVELERENERRRRESERLSGRFGLDLLQTEEEALAYAAMLSEESLALDAQRRSSLMGTPVVPSNPWSSEASPTDMDGNEFDADLSAAIRLSLDENNFDAALPAASLTSSSPSSPYDAPLRFTRNGRRSSEASPRSTPLRMDGTAIDLSRKQQEEYDLDFALQLRLAEEQSLLTLSGNVEEEFPALSGTPEGKGKSNLRG